MLIAICEAVLGWVARKRETEVPDKSFNIPDGIEKTPFRAGGCSSKCCNARCHDHDKGTPHE